MKPKICLTASTFLIHQDKVLLIKHKKLQQWLGPGGHIDENERPHEAAEREFLEETGLRVAACSAGATVSAIDQDQHVFHPLPLAINEHWVCQENYQARLKASQHNQPYAPHPQWLRGCERHFNFVYLARLVGPLQIRPQAGESKEIQWFSLSELAGEYRSQLASSIFAVVSLAFELANSPQA